MKLLWKQTFKNMYQNKSYVMILFLLTSLTSFMYFFVRFSIDMNLPAIEQLLQTGVDLSENQQKYVTALQSNTILANNFLIVSLLLSAFVFYMFYKRYFTLHQKEIGCYKALGFTNTEISRLFVLFSFMICSVATLVGLIGGWFGSDIMIDASKASYNIEEVQKGINLISFFYGVCLVIIVLAVITLLACSQFFKKDAALLISGKDSQKENRIIIAISNKLANLFPEKSRFSIRIALRKPMTILLTITAVGAVTTLFIMSFSLNLSSQKVFSSQTKGHHYNYNTRFDSYQYGSLEDSEIVYYLRAPIEEEAKTGLRQVIGVNATGTLLELESMNNERLAIPKGEYVIINPALVELYGLQIGDTMTFMINGQVRIAVISHIAQNAEADTVYISKTQLAKWLNVPNDAYSGVWSKKLIKGDHANVITKEQRLDELDQAAVSNRISGVINQVIGCVIGILLIYLVLLLNFQDSLKDILVLNLLGYSPKKINNMLITVYRPIIWIAFIIMLYPSIWMVKSIQKGLSIQTEDYMPFQTNLSIILAVFLIINMIYSIVQIFFHKKIRRIVKQEKTADYVN
ncbi:ABC transporter permease [Bacillus sp. Bva_UNVM-123]|uniref:FtsX-like permease family protein n=1 Tax=Bacillus sp. Bva_UNVM-123 TaxID=2829798 RepID=UPI00391F89F9